MLSNAINPSAGSASKFNPSRHPLSIIENLARRIAPRFIFELSRYRYRPQSLSDDRTIIHVPGLRLNSTYVHSLIQSLQGEEELAFHSRAFDPSGRIFHIPLIDFSCTSTNEAMTSTQHILDNDLASSLVLCQSGRSLHGYIPRLISAESWVRFMGTILLMNMPDRPPITDARWVGHRLRAGYASLRWSCNTSHYKSIPQVI
jgi:hypothetical protein